MTFNNITNLAGINSYFAFLKIFIKKRLFLFILAQIFSFAWTMDNILWPYVLKMIIDKITLFDGNREQIWSILLPVIFFAVILWFTIELFFRLSGVIMAYIMPKTVAEIRMSMYDYVSKHSYSYFSNNFAGSLSNKISDMVGSTATLIYMGMGFFLPIFATLIITLIIFFFTNVMIASVVLLWLVIHFSVVLHTSKKIDRLSNIHSEAKSVLSGKIVDSFTNVLNVKLFARNKFELEHLGKYQDDERRKNSANFWYMEKAKLIYTIISFVFGLILTHGVLIYSYSKGHISNGEFVYIFILTGKITFLSWHLAFECPNFFKDLGTCKQALSIIKESHEIKDSPNAAELKVDKGRIEFRDVSFSYNNGKQVFDSKNVMIKAGEKVGLVGFSGSGKTTFINLIMRFFDVSSGQILIDGQDIKAVSQDSLRKNISMIPQDPILFHRTIYDNIAYGDVDASYDQIIEASKQANAHEFIEKLPNGYGSLVGERGVNLSGGQRQRIAIARIILENSPILILDEATSALDSLTEKYIQNNLGKLMQDKTTIVIAHRLSTLDQMDRLLVFDNGKIVEDGTHSELLAKKGHYFKLWNMQMSGFLPE